MTSQPTRVAIITGAGRNIGRAIALRLARDGVAITVNVRESIDEGEATVAAIKAIGGQAILVQADITKRDQVDRMVAATLARFGRIDILVNNAGIRKEVPFEQLDYATWRQSLDVCLDGAMHCAQACLAALKAADGGRHIINIGGLTAHTGGAERAHVITAKAGLVGLTRALACELTPMGITVNCVSPGMIDTVRVGTSASAKPAHHAGRNMLTGRRGTAEEVAESVAWLTGPGGQYVTGQVIHVNGGVYLGG